MQGVSPAMAPIHSINGICHQPTNNFARADGSIGHWTIYSTYRSNIRVGLLSLLSPEAFSEVRTLLKNALVAGAAPGPAGGAYSAPSGLHLD